MAYNYSNRITINEYDYSTASSVTTGEQIGYTVVKSKNGPSKPVLISAGDLNTFKDIFGEAETTTALEEASSLYEAQTFVSSYACYVSAPASNTYKVKALELKNSNGTYTLTEATVSYQEDSDDYTLGTDVIAMFVPKYPTNRLFHVELKGSTVATETTRLFVTAWMDGAYHNSNHKYTDIEIDLDDLKTNESGAYVGCTENNDDYASNNLFICITPSSTTGIDLHGKTLSATTTALSTSDEKTPTFDWSELTGEGEGALNQSELEDINIVFSTETFSGVTTSGFFSLGENDDLKTSAFLFNITCPLGDAEELSVGSRYWNIYNEGYLSLSNGKKIKTNFIGARAVMQCRINDVKLGGWAPMYLNTGTSSSGIGGQLGVKVDKMAKNLKKEQINALCEKHYNPIIKDSTYGTMLINQMTCKGGATTDWSYIGHVASFLQFEKDMLPILKDQIGKPNNPYYRNLRASQVQRLLDERTSGEDRIWAQAEVNTSTDDGINDADNRNNRMFVISVKVKVEVFSEWVVLNFTNVDQATVIG